MRDESDRDGMRVVVEVKRGATASVRRSGCGVIVLLWASTMGIMLSL